MDIHNLIMDIHNLIMDIHNYRVYALLAFHKLPLQPVMKITSKWWHCRFSALETELYKLTSKSHQGAVSIRKTVLPGMAIPMLKIRRPNGRLIFNMEIAIRR